MQNNKLKTGLWIKTFEGQQQLSGTLTKEIIEEITAQGGTFFINIYKNDRKEKDNQPDYQLYLKPMKPRGQIVDKNSDIPF